MHMPSIDLKDSQWQIAYDGHGQVQFIQDAITMKPAVANSLQETHAALVLSRWPANKYFDLEIVFENVRSLRAGTPQAWEVFWLFFNYQSTPNQQKKTNYLILKPNGLEIGRAEQEVQQDILKTWSQPISRFGQDYRLRLQRWSTKLIITVNDAPDVVYEFINDRQKPFDQVGKIGLYTEDAEVRIKSFRYKKL